MNVRRSMLALVVAIGAVLIAASPAFADFGSDPDEPFVVLTGALVVPNASAVSDAIIFNGDATILGDVDGQVIAFNGDITVSGNVTDNVVSFNGHVTLLAGAHVGGDIASRFIPQIAPTATVDGRLRSARRLDVNFGKLDRGEPHLHLAGHDRLVLPPGAPARAVRAARRRGRRFDGGWSARGVDRLRLPHVAGHPHRRGARDRRAAGDPARRRRAAGARPALLAGLHRGRLRAREAADLRSGQVDAGVPRGLGHPARARVDPGPREPRVARRDRLGAGRAGHRGRTAGRPTADAAGAGMAVSGTPPPPVPPPPPVVTG